ncbi:MAG: redox-regulated ATPase YchF [Chloroflexi bacterium]|nr:redox-regulated ATPase YchF [Chloroflexota bacterium]MBU1747480.1 redox-regulated ATPase YchF [Chloroflexota bacterium]MBU1878320.1 redox-regulated ATPase YchF [Chloroflexota bacterium]
MPLSLGLVGLPNAGKSTLFNALTNAGAAVAAYPFTTIDQNVGMAMVPDARLDRVAAIVQPERVIPTAIEFIDIAGLVEGASHGEGLGNQFLGHIRNVDAVAMVLRCFANPDVTHVYGDVDPVRDIAVLDTELCLADLTVVERRVEKLKPQARAGEKAIQSELRLLERVQAGLDAGTPARWQGLSPDDASQLGAISLVSDKPVLYVANVGEDTSPGDPAAVAVENYAREHGAVAVRVCAQVEMELAELDPDEAAEYRADLLGEHEGGLARVIAASYRLLDLVTFLTTTGGKECRAWTIRRGTKAPQAAGKVHTDMERGFIRAEVVAFPDLDAAGGFAALRERGLLRLEGKDYVVQDGDVIHFRFAT